MKLVGQHEREALPDAHLFAAQALQLEGQWREAERHYVEAKDWKAAVGMYRWVACRVHACERQWSCLASYVVLRE